MADTRDTRERILRQLDAEIEELEEQRAEVADPELDGEVVDREKERAQLATRNQP